MRKSLLIACTFIAAAIIFLVVTINDNPSHIYLIPEDFAGEVTVTFEQAGSPPLQKEGRSYIYSIPQSGKLSTSSKMQAGSVEVYFVDRNGGRKKASQEVLHGGVSTGSSDGRTTVVFFIGSKDQYDNYVKQR